MRASIQRRLRGPGESTVIDRADNGNEFLCLSCRNGRLRSGQHTQTEVWCGEPPFNTAYEGSSPVPFVITACDEFARVDISQPTRAELKSLERTAYYIIRSEEGRGPTLIPPDVAKQKGIFEDYD